MQPSRRNLKGFVKIGSYDFNSETREGSTWWLNQPISKIFIKLDHETPQNRDENNKNIFELPPPNHRSEDSCMIYLDLDVSENSGTPKSSILITFSIINHPFWDTTIFGNTHLYENGTRNLTFMNSNCGYNVVTFCYRDPGHY